MRNVTITLDEETARWARVEAAKADTSVSRWIGSLLSEQRSRRAELAVAHDAYASRSGGLTPLKGPGERYPTRDQLHER